MEFERKIDKFERRYDARVQESGYAYDMRDIAYPYLANMDAYSYAQTARKIKTVSVNMTESSLYNLLDYLDYLERVTRNPADISDHSVSTRERYYSEIMNARYNEEKLRKQHPALQDAWEQYEAMKILLTK